MSRVPLVVMHGAASSPGVALAAFTAVPGAQSFWAAGHGPGGPRSERSRSVCGARAAAGAGPADSDCARLDALVHAVRPPAVAGISYGAHQVARWAATGAARSCGVRRLVLVMPAWTGTPGPVAAATAAQADEFAANGIAAALARIRRDHPGWVADALAASWPLHDAARLVPALRAIAASLGPSVDELRAIDVPVTTVALGGDPLHPADVAARWAATVPDGELVTVTATCLADLGAAVSHRIADAAGPA